MIPDFKEAEKAVHYPQDRRRFIGIKPYMLITIGIITLSMVIAAWLQYLFLGLPVDPSLSLPPITADDPIGFPMWVNVSHWDNLFF